MGQVLCSVVNDLKIERGCVGDYDTLKRFHYRDGPLGPVDKVFRMVESNPVRHRLAGVVGVIVYCMPSANLELRNMASGGIFTGFTDKSLQMQMVNKYVRTIARVVIDPRYRGLGLASRLVEQTMEQMQYPWIESMAVMGQVNPFFEKAGMVKVEAGLNPKCEIMKEVLELAGIGEHLWFEPSKVREMIDGLDEHWQKYVHKHIDGFLSGYGKRIQMEWGDGKVGYVLARLFNRPNYYYMLREELFAN